MKLAGIFFDLIPVSDLIQDKNAFKQKGLLEFYFLIALPKTLLQFIQ
jgi:hypothetical protein